LSQLQPPGTDGGAQASAWQQFFLAETVADLKQAANLAADDPYVIGMAAFFQAMSSLPKDVPKASKSLKDGVWPFLPDASRTYVQEAMSRLEHLSRTGDPTTAAGALPALGVLQLLMQHDRAAAEENLRRSTELRPDADGPWEVRTVLGARSNRWRDRVTLCEERLKAKDSARFRMILAKLHEQRGKTEEVEKQVQAAVKLAPDNLLANTALAALRLRQATTAEALTQVGEMMARVKQSMFAGASQDDQCSFEFLHGLYFGLAGNWARARDHFRRLREVSPSEATYREAYEALGLWGTEGSFSQPSPGTDAKGP